MMAKQEISNLSCLRLLGGSFSFNFIIVKDMIDHQLSFEKESRCLQLRITSEKLLTC